MRAIGPAPSDGMRTSSCLNPKSNYTTSNCPQQQGSMVGFDKRMRPKPDNKERDG